MMQQSISKYTDTTFTILLGLAFTSLFLGQAVMHLVGLAFIIALIIFRPRLPWIAPFWWMIAFITWEFLSDYLGPYSGNGMEGMGIGYHFLFLFVPLVLPVINYGLLIIYAGVGAIASAILMWLQAIIGLDLNATPWRINWDGGLMFERTPGFNKRAWVIQFIHSLVGLVMLPHIKWNKPIHIIAFTGFITGVVLPQVRGVIAALCVGFGTQLMFVKQSLKKADYIKRAFVILIFAALLIGTLAYLRPGFLNSMAGGNNRDAIFTVSIEMYKQNPHTGIGGGKHFQDLYIQTWDNLSENPILKGKSGSGLHTQIGHTHSDYIMLLVHNGWPALLLWLAFVIHSLKFVWQFGTHSERIIFTSLVLMHHIAGIAETYLDYSNTAYAIFLCYGLAMHGPIKRYQEQHNTA